MSDVEFDEESYQAYEDELYGQTSPNSDDSDVESEVAEILYGQVHYSFSLPESTNKGKEVIEVSSQAESSDETRKEGWQDDVIAISSDENENEPLEITENWELIDKDVNGGKEFSGKRSASRYYKEEKRSMYIRCHNCNERGHMAVDCPDPKKVIKCCLCGGQGHYKRSCPNELCFNCDQPGHQSRSCRKPRRRHYDQCHRCFLEGHLQNDCPDLWRQYHRTTQVGRIVQPTEDEDTDRPVYCYNCAKEGHYGYECSQDRMDPRQATSFPFIVHYDGCPTTPSDRGGHRHFSNRNQWGHSYQGGHALGQIGDKRRHSCPSQQQLHQRDDSGHSHGHAHTPHSHEGKRGRKREHDRDPDQNYKKSISSRKGRMQIQIQNSPLEEGQSKKRRKKNKKRVSDEKEEDNTRMVYYSLPDDHPGLQRDDGPKKKKKMGKTQRLERKAQLMEIASKHEETRDIPYWMFRPKYQNDQLVSAKKRPLLRLAQELGRAHPYKSDSTPVLLKPSYKRPSRPAKQKPRDRGFRKSNTDYQNRKFNTM
ncbi:zinc finger CCHC domain-containing protein 7 isoform X2 [Nematostella vectensis]|uniref:zinc finger CCHC domain-containing protein 7 isoform X2 n=1 Tax=Nematostella vectensis TaxID=45351 RepID=UPI0013903C3B|nr:zinc finger CCHC domain-containing protein 7 isoform X2 [Nematostella vectensis]